MIQNIFREYDIRGIVGDFLHVQGGVGPKEDCLPSCGLVGHDHAVQLHVATFGVTSRKCEGLCAGEESYYG